MQHYAAQVQQSAHSLRASQYGRPKRKRDGDDHEDADEPERGDDTQGPTGLPLEEDAAETASKSFPHAPARKPSHHYNHTQIQKGLAGLDPPLFAVNATSKSRPVGRSVDASAVRQTHLGVLTTVLHRCLLEGDFPRAGRAWGLILRSQVQGVPVDPRNHGRWGIGAELLLHQNIRDPFADGQNENDHDGLPNGQAFYSEEGFELARDYYERLIVQHPHRKWVPRAIDDLTFYPAMFSLWIYETCERSRRARKQHEEHSHIADEDTTMASEDANVHASEIVAEELKQARQIASRMDQLIVSPPFDKHADLLQLRGMVGLWLADLVLGKVAGQDSDEWGQTSNYDVIETNESISEKVQRYIESRRELKGALESFGRAQANGRPVAGMVDGIEAKIEDLSRKIASREEG